jgi:hypothetical protein
LLEESIIRVFKEYVRDMRLDKKWPGHTDDAVTMDHYIDFIDRETLVRMNGLGIDMATRINEMGEVVAVQKVQEAAERAKTIKNPQSSSD